jgi:hypothetical protein
VPSCSITTRAHTHTKPAPRSLLTQNSPQFVRCVAAVRLTYTRSWHVHPVQLPHTSQRINRGALRRSGRQHTRTIHRHIRLLQTRDRHDTPASYSTRTQDPELLLIRRGRSRKRTHTRHVCATHLLWASSRCLPGDLSTLQLTRTHATWLHRSFHRTSHRLERPSLA